MKIYLQRPWRFADSPYYKYLLQNPPKGITYLGQVQKQGAIEEKWKFTILHKIKENVRKFLHFVPIPIPNAHLTRSKEKYDLIHCAHCLSLNKHPWVCDTEWVGQFWIAAGEKKNPNKYFVRKILKSKHFKKFLHGLNGQNKVY